MAMTQRDLVRDQLAAGSRVTAESVGIPRPSLSAVVSALRKTGLDIVNEDGEYVLVRPPSANGAHGTADVDVDIDLTGRRPVPAINGTLRTVSLRALGDTPDGPVEVTVTDGRHEWTFSA